MIGNVKRECDKKEQLLLFKIKEAEERESEASNLMECYVNLQKEYAEKKDALYGVTVGALIYSFLSTVLAACLSERFSADFIQFLVFATDLIYGIFTLALDGAWELKSMIPIPFMAGLLAVIVFLFLYGVISGGLVFLFYKFFHFYKEKFCDLRCLVVALISMAIIVWFADAMFFIKSNVILIWILIQIIYLVVRIILT